MSRSSALSELCRSLAGIQLFRSGFGQPITVERRPPDHPAEWRLRMAKMLT